MKRLWFAIIFCFFEIGLSIFKIKWGLDDQFSIQNKNKLTRGIFGMALSQIRTHLLTIFHQSELKSFIWIHNFALWLHEFECLFEANFKLFNEKCNYHWCAPRNPCLAVNKHIAFSNVLINKVEGFFEKMANIFRGFIADIDP